MPTQLLILDPEPRRPRYTVRRDGDLYWTVVENGNHITCITDGEASARAIAQLLNRQRQTLPQVKPLPVVIGSVGLN